MLDAFADYDPSKIVMKVKLHLLVHAIEDVEHIGPLLGAITESFECYNGVFRGASVFSKGLASSRDIAVSLAAMETVRYRATGAWWKAKVGDDSEWVHAGKGIRQMLETQPVFQVLLGWPQLDPPKITPGNYSVHFFSVLCMLNYDVAHRYRNLETSTKEFK